MAKASKGSVSVQSFQGRLRLYWRVDGQRYYFTLGYPDTAQHRKIAHLKAGQIERDILFERFDPTLEKYRSGSQPPVVLASLREIWGKFVDYKRPQVAASTLRSQYRPQTAYVHRAPTDNPMDAAIVRDWAVRAIPLDSAKRLMKALNQCGEWATASGLVERNAFAGMAREIRLPKSWEDDEIDPFSCLERDQIIYVFKNNYYYKYYSDLIQFLFRTGCRPSEALALQWKHIDRRYGAIAFQQALTCSENGLRIKNGLKTQEKRIFPCNEALREQLQAMRKASGADDLVFPAPRGGRYIDWSNFGSRGWKTVLSECNLRYRNPYQTRHTFITLALENGMSTQDVAKICGNSPDMIYRHYAGASRSIAVPVF